MHALPLRLLALALPVTLAAAAPVIPGYERTSVETPERRGLILMGELGCVRCHAPTPKAAVWLVPREAPDLRVLAKDLQSGWIASRLAHPHEVDPSSPMPDVLHELTDTERREAARALEAFLREGLEYDPSEPHAGDVEAGEDLYHRVGCIACHEPFEPPEVAWSDDPFFDPDSVSIPELSTPSVPFPRLADKFRPGALADFLQAPHTRRPAGRMPGLKLRDEEARDIAAYLLHATVGQTGPPAVPESSVSVNGAGLFDRQGCAACHQVVHKPGTSKIDVFGAPDLLALDVDAPDGCLSEQPSKDAVRYLLDDTMRSDIRAALKFLSDPPRLSSGDQLDARLTVLNCYACHTRDGQGGPEPGRDMYFLSNDQADLGDEGRLPPPLTRVGAKLTETWLNTVLHGGEKIRPFMETRMPDYGPTHGDSLARLLLATDTADLPPPKDTGLEHHHRNRYGRELLGVNGLGCVTCHNLNDHKSVGPPGVDLARAPERLRPAWFTEYLLDPAAYRPRTRMPQFFPEGKSSYPKLFDGHPVKQIEAIWTYLKEADVSRLPDGMEPSGHFELIPTDEPIVHRTFLTGVGTRAIAVGYPGGINIAVDGSTGALALLWKGRFLSAESAWADRFTPYVSPLGEAAQSMPPGPAVAALSTRDTPWPDQNSDLHFAGYTLDAAGAPTFLTRVGTMTLQESLQPRDGAVGLTRVVRADHVEETCYLRVARSASIAVEDKVYHTGEGLRLRVVGLPDESVFTRDENGAKELLVELAPAKEPILMEIEVTW